MGRVFWVRARSGSGHRRRRSCLGRLLQRIRMIGHAGRLLATMMVNPSLLIALVIGV